MPFENIRDFSALSQEIKWVLLITDVKSIKLNWSEDERPSNLFLECFLESLRREKIWHLIILFLRFCFLLWFFLLHWLLLCWCIFSSFPLKSLLLRLLSLLTLLDNVLGVIYLLLLFIIFTVGPGIKIGQGLHNIFMVFLLKSMLKTLEDPFAIVEE